MTARIADPLLKRIAELESENDRLRAALSTVIPAAEKWHERQFEFVCRHEPDDCQCDAEAVSWVQLEKARAALAVKE